MRAHVPCHRRAARQRSLALVVVVTALLSLGVVTAPARASTDSAAGWSRSALSRIAAVAPDPGFVVTPGIVFNHPFRKAERTNIQRKIVETVRNVPAGESIRVITWNFDSAKLTKVLIAAHRRGVSVQVLMSRGIARSQGPGRPYPALRTQLADGNLDRPPATQSWIRTCRQTCRGKRGSMHSKLMLVSRSGATRNIVMQGSANFTRAAAYNQFNDWTTATENHALYAGWMHMWNQATQDRAVAPLQFAVGDMTSLFAPHAKTADPVLKLLNQVECAGASGVPGGRTKVRIANAVWGDERGARIARTVRTLAHEGCDVRIVFMMMSGKIRGILRGVPAKQMVFITGAMANKFKDRYLHMKGLAVRGNINRQADGSAVLSSSRNWNELSWHSDEQTMIIHGDAALADQYAGWVDLVYRQAPRSINNYVASADSRARPAPGTEYLRPRDYPFHELELN